MEKTICIILAPGFEEIEAIAPADVLRRLGYNVKLLALDNHETVTGAHGIRVTADAAFDTFDCAGADAVFLPGGLPGTIHLRDSMDLRKRLQNAYSNGKYLAAVCAAGIVLHTAGIAQNKRITGYPGCEELSGDPTLRFTGNHTEADGQLLTGRGPGAAVAMACELARALGTPPDTIRSLLEGMFLAP